MRPRWGSTPRFERWGPKRRLDALPLVCSACDSRDVDALFDNAPDGGDQAASRLIDAWRARPPGARR